MTDPVTRLNAALDGRYRIEREVGAGGMATVYLATDLRHNRKVALKVLKPELAAVVGAERFLTEIETTAALQHPHILPLFDSGEADGFLFYVMPYVDGESLRDRLDREQQLPVDEAVELVRTVAAALDHAHREGVIHRDIKPANILLRDGQPLIADFGIALAVGSASGGRMTETGMSLGTPYYMSPEQAMGEDQIGPGSDTYSTAAVLYELLVGEPPYTGPTAQAVLGKILSSDPVSVSGARRTIPRNVDAAIQKGLERLPADRFRSARAFADALGDPGFRHGATAGGASVGASRWWKIAAVIAGAAALIEFVALVGGGGSSDDPAIVSTARHRIPAFGANVARPIGKFTAIAPDGSSFVYPVSPDSGDTWQLWIKPANAVDPRPIPNTEMGQNATYSPDSEWIGFFAGVELKKLRLSDGFTVTLVDDMGGGNMVALAWLEDGTIVFEMAGQVLAQIPDDGSQAPDTLQDYGAMGLTQFTWAGGLPGDEGVLVSVCGTGCDTEMRLGVYDRAADTTRILVDQAARAWYVPDDRLIYVLSDGSVFVAPFDLDGLAVNGPGVPLFDGVTVAISSPELVVGRDGTMIHDRRDADLEAFFTAPVWVDRSDTVRGAVSNLPLGVYSDLSLSSDDEKLAMVVADEVTSLGNPVVSQIWVSELPDGPRTRLTNEDNARTRRPVWLPGDTSLAYVHHPIGEWDEAEARTVVADGSQAGPHQSLFGTDQGLVEYLPVVGTDTMLFRLGSPDNLNRPASLGIGDLRTGQWDSLAVTPFNEFGVDLSPDRRWFAYMTDASGQVEVAVRPYPRGDQLVMVSTDGGSSPVWSHDGTELFYIDGEGWLVAAAYESGERLEITGRTRLLETSRFVWYDGGWRVFDVSADDERFLFLANVAETGTERAEFVLVHDFFDELPDVSGR